MTQRRHIRICREGWYYLFVLSFIVGGAVMRQINLLILLAGLMIGPLILNWRLVVATLRGLDVRRGLPDRVFAGDLLMVDVIVANARRRLGSWAVVAQDWIQLAEAGQREYRTSVEVLLPHVAAGQESRASYRCYLNRRGWYEFGPLKLSTKFPLGLVRSSTTVRRGGRLLVYPRLGRLTPQWTRLVEADRPGDQRAMQRRALVEGGDFYGIRDWRSGDSKRWIHWRASAKLADLAVRQFEQQRSRDLAIVLDLWQPNVPEPGDQECVELAISFAATVISDACRRGGNRLTVAMAGENVAHFHAPASLMFRHQVLEQMAVVAAGISDGLGDALQRTLDDVPAGARTVVVSTRGPDAAAALTYSDKRIEPAALEGLLWINVANDELADLFQLD